MHVTQRLSHLLFNEFSSSLIIALLLNLLCIECQIECPVDINIIKVVQVYAQMNPIDPCVLDVGPIVFLTNKGIR